MVLWKLALCLTIGLSCSRPPAPRVAHAKEPEPAPAPGKTRRIIRSAGTTRAARSYTVQTPRIEGQPGRITLVRIIANGSVVKEGDLLAEFDQVQQLDLGRDTAAKFDDLSHQIQQKKAQNRADAARRTAEMREAQAELSKARIELRKGSVLPEIDRQKNEVTAENAARRVASLEKSHAARDRADAAALRILELKGDRQKVGLERVETNLKRMVIKAPLAGMVALENIWRSGTMGPAQEGDQLYPGQSMLRIFDPSQMLVQTTVNQADGARLSAGAKAKIRLDAYPGLEFDAVLEYASPVAASALDSPIRFFPASFRILKTDPRILPDLSAAVDIVSEGS